MRCVPRDSRRAVGAAPTSPASGEAVVEPEGRRSRQGAARARLARLGGGQAGPCGLRGGWGAPGALGGRAPWAQTKPGADAPATTRAAQRVGAGESRESCGATAGTGVEARPPSLRAYGRAPRGAPDRVGSRSPMGQLRAHGLRRLGGIQAQEGRVLEI